MWHPPPSNVYQRWRPEVPRLPSSPGSQALCTHQDGWLQTSHFQHPQKRTCSDQWLPDSAHYPLQREAKIRSVNGFPCPEGQRFSTHQWPLHFPSFKEIQKSEESSDGLSMKSKSCDCLYSTETLQIIQKKEKHPDILWTVWSSHLMSVWIICFRTHLIFCLYFRKLFLCCLSLILFNK